MLDNILDLGSTFDLQLLWEYRVVLLSGLLYNFYIFFLTVGIAIGLGLVAAVIRLSSTSSCAASDAYAEVCRNTPEYIALIWIFYVPPLLLSIAMDENVSFTPVLAAVIALSLTFSGYFTETFRAGILSVPKGHIEAARALGMSRALVLRRVVLPQAVRHMLPEAMNQLVSLFKATALCPSSRFRICSIRSRSWPRGRPGLCRCTRPRRSSTSCWYSLSRPWRRSSAILGARVEVRNTNPMESQWTRVLWRNRELMWDGLVVTTQITTIGFIGAVVAGFVLCMIWMYVKPCDGRHGR